MWTSDISFPPQKEQNNLQSRILAQNQVFFGEATSLQKAQEKMTQFHHGVSFGFVPEAF